MKYEKFDIVLNKTEGATDFKPSVTFYILDTIKEMTMIEARPLVIVCPGGGYGYKSPREGEPVAMQYLAAGFHTAILDYSVAPARYPSSARELAHAVAIAREHAKEWKIAENGIYVSGFSAGGHLAATLSTIWDDDIFFEEFGKTRADYSDIKAVPWRPDGAVLCYPVVTLLEYTHGGSRDNLLGEGASREKLEALSMECRVTKNTVPAFLFHTGADESVPVENSLNYVAALRKAGIPFEFHVFEKGGHGLSLCNELSSAYENQNVPANTPWIDLAITWVKGRI